MPEVLGMAFNQEATGAGGWGVKRTVDVVIALAVLGGAIVGTGYIIVRLVEVAILYSVN